MSDVAIGFHYTRPEMIYLFEYLVYHLRPYGVKFGDQQLNNISPNGTFGLHSKADIS